MIPQIGPLRTSAGTGGAATLGVDTDPYSIFSCCGFLFFTGSSFGSAASVAAVSPSARNVG